MPTGAADLRYGELPQLQQRYQSLEEKLKGLDTLVADGVGAEQVAAIVSRWTGIPVTRLSDRYITSRFLPDKAIDLMDEACAVVRVELDSEPAVLDSVKRRRLQLQVEAAALRAEEGLDALSTERLEAVKTELAELQAEQAKLESQYAAAKAVLGQLADCRREIEDTQWAIEENERRAQIERKSRSSILSPPRDHCWSESLNCARRRGGPALRRASAAPTGKQNAMQLKCSGQC